MAWKQAFNRLVSLGCLLCVFFCEPLRAETYPVVPVEPGQWRKEVMAFGLVTAWSKTNIMVPFALKITDVQVGPGLPVSTGTVLLGFHAPDLLKDISDYANRRKLLIVAERKQEIVRKEAKERTLTRRDAIGAEEMVAQYRADLEQSWDKLQADLEVLNNDMKRAEVNVLFDQRRLAVVADMIGVLRAPFTGIVKNIPPQNGTWMQPNTPLLELEDLHQVYVDVSIPEKALSTWLDGETVVKKDNKVFELKRLPGKPGIDIHNGMRKLMFKTDNPEILLRDGQWIQVVHRGPLQPVLWVPETAVVSRNNKTWCILAEGKKYSPRQVEVGDASNGKVPVLSGLTPGQQVVRENGYELLYRNVKELTKFVD